jgi:hypothetical protein
MKEGQLYLINTYKDKKTISLISTNHAKRLINNNEKFVTMIVIPRKIRL